MVKNVDKWSKTSTVATGRLWLTDDGAIAVKEFLRKNLLASVATQKDGKVVYHKPVAEFWD